MTSTRKGYHQPKLREEENRKKRFGHFVALRRVELELSQDKVAKQIGVNQSQISRVESGDQIIRDHSKLGRYALALNFEPGSYEYVKFFRLAGYVLPSGAETVDLEFVTDYALRVHKVLMRGDPEQAYDIANFVSYKIRSYLDKLGSESTLYLPLARILVEVLIEQAGVLKLTRPRQDILPNTQSFIMKMESLAKETGDMEIEGIYRLNLGDSYYMNGRYDLSAKHLVKAIDLLEKPFYRLWTVRQLAIVFARLHEETKFNLYSSLALKEVELGDAPDEQIAAVLEGLGRAWGVFGSTKSYECIDSAKHIGRQLRSRGNRMFFRDIQLARSEVEAAKHLGDLNTNHIQSVAETGYQLALKHGFKGHAKKIERLVGYGN